MQGGRQLNPIYFFWGIFLPVICIFVVVRLCRGRSDGRMSRHLARFDRWGRYLGLVLLALALFGLAFVLLVGFPE